MTRKIQIVYNGKAIGEMSEDNLDAFIRQAKRTTIIARTATVCIMEA